MGFRGQRLRDVFHAGALHDIGLIRAENRVRAVASNNLEGLGWHAEAGYELLKDNEFFAEAAPTVWLSHLPAAGRSTTLRQLGASPRNLVSNRSA